jgi:hypothetical protein
MDTLSSLSDTSVSAYGIKTYIHKSYLIYSKNSEKVKYFVDLLRGKMSLPFFDIFPLAMGLLEDVAKL